QLELRKKFLLTCGRSSKERCVKLRFLLCPLHSPFCFLATSSRQQSINRENLLTTIRSTFGQHWRDQQLDYWRLRWDACTRRHTMRYVIQKLRCALPCCEYSSQPLPDMFSRYNFLNGSVSTPHGVWPA